MSAQKKRQDKNNQNLVKAMELAKAGQREDALSMFDKVVKADPMNTAANFFYAVALYETHQYEKAIIYFEKANELKPEWIDCLSSLASGYNILERYEDALQAVDQAINVQPDHAHSYALKAVILKNLDRADEGIYFAKQAMKIEPSLRSAYVNLGACYDNLKRYDEAIEQFEKAIEIDPSYAIAYREMAASYLAMVENDASKKELVLDRMIDACNKSVLLDPGDYVSHANRASLLTHLGFQREGLESYVQTLALKSDQPNVRSDYLMSLHYMDDIDRDWLFEEHLQWDEIHCAHISEKPRDSFDNDKDLHKKLRIGMVSSGFKSHPVGRMIIQCLENINYEKLEFYAYSICDPADYSDLTDRLKKCCTEWLEAADYDHERLIEKVRSDKIDIMFDLVGHSEGGTMLQAFAARMAPVQAKWVGGLFDTSGVPEIDWLIGDKVQTPEEHDKWYTERVYRMPNDYICYDIPPQKPDVDELPALKKGYVTFGNLNHVAKSNETSIKLWSQVLNAVADSQMILRTKGMEADSVKQRIWSSFEKHGVERSRVIIEGGCQHFEFLDTYNRIDIALDPHPYSGGLTTCEALLMGVPVITLAGDTFAGRHAATHMVHAGLKDWVVDGAEDYVALAKDKTNDLEVLSELRSGLRDKLLRSSLTDGKQFAKDFEDALRSMWQEFLS